MVFETETVLSYFVVVTCDMRSRVQACGWWLVPLLKTYGTLNLLFYTFFTLSSIVSFLRGVYNGVTELN